METVVLSQADLWLFYAVVFVPAYLVWAAALIYVRYDFSKIWKHLEKQSKEHQELSERLSRNHQELTRN